MKLLRSTILSIFFMFFLVSGATATTHTFSAGDLDDLDHYDSYTWCIEWSVPEGEKIVGASLSFDNIRNWNSRSNDLYVRLVDEGLSGGSQVSGFPALRRFWDGQASGDYFAGLGGILLNHWEDLPNTAQDITYLFDADELDALIAYSEDGKFWLTFDPDCHFWNDGVSFTIETAHTPIPAPVLLLGTGLIGLAGFRRRPRRK